MSILAHRAQRIQPSQTLAITALVDQLRRDGRNIIDLGAGEPDFDTPQVIKDAAIRAIEKGHTKYTPSTGIFELKEAIGEKLATDNGLEYTPAEIVVTCGAKHALVNVMLALCEQGDEVILQAPYWTSYVEQIRFVNATPVVLQTDESTDFKVSAGQLRDAITDRTKVVLMSSPGNPTGAVYTAADVAELTEVVQNAGCYLLSDEIYEKIIYDGEVHVSFGAGSVSKHMTIIVNGLSKAYAMTGWRIGYVAANAEVIKGVAKIQSHSTSNPCSISQHAAIAALKTDAGIVREMVEAFDDRRRFVVEELKKIPRITCTRPKGAFYLFPNVSAYFGSTVNGQTIQNSMDLCAFLLAEQGVALVPGEAFGTPNNVRLSYATSVENLQKALTKIALGLQNLRDGS